MNELSRALCVKTLQHRSETQVDDASVVSSRELVLGDDDFTLHQKDLMM